MNMQRTWLLPSPATMTPARVFSPPSLVHTRQPQPPPRLSSALCTSTTGVSSGELTARERRQLRKESRERKTGTWNWKAEVEEKLLVKPKKRYASWTEELNLDNLALLGPQWWVLRVSRLNSQETADRLARAFVRVYPNMDFKVYIPSVSVKKKLKSGSYSVKPKALFPGCVFLHCTLNKEIHDFVRECPGIGGFVGSRVGNTKRQINRPRPVEEEEMEVMFREAKEEQQDIDRAFEEEQQKVDGDDDDDDVDVGASSSKQQKKSTTTKKNKKKKHTRDEDEDVAAVGSTVGVLSGPFSDYTGRVKDIDRKTGKATVGFMLFGKECFVDLGLDQIEIRTPS